MGGNCEVNEVMGQGNPWYTRRAGLIVSGIFVVSTIIVTWVNVTRHARNYRAPMEQRQIIRIIYMPLAYGGIGWLSYRFIHHYVYLSLIYVVYEVFALSAFLYLMIQYVANTAATTSVEAALIKKEKSRLPAPWCCFRYRPTKSSFMHMVKWLVFQFVVIRPIVSIISIILYALGVLCPTDMNPTNPNFWLTVVDIFSMITAMYGLILFYKLTNQELKEHHPLLKFGIVKGVIFITIIQELVFRSLNSSGTIKPTESWTSTEVADGLNAFLLTIEMAVASVIMLRAFSAQEYFNPDRPRGTATQAIIDSINFGDFISEMKQSLVFFWRSRERISPHEDQGPLVPLASNEPKFHKATGSGASFVRVDSETSPKNETRVTVESVV